MGLGLALYYAVGQIKKNQKTIEDKQEAEVESLTERVVTTESKLEQCQEEHKKNYESSLETQKVIGSLESRIASMEGEKLGAIAIAKHLGAKIDQSTDKLSSELSDSMDELLAGIKTLKGDT